MTKKYIAYGSNLNMEQTAYRCPNAKMIGTTEIKDYELLFRGGENNAYATIEPHPGKSVPVGIWEVDSIDEKSLDRYEGYPNYYDKKQMQFVLDGELIEGMVYIMNPHFSMNHPSELYLNTIKQGYKDCSIDVKRFNEIVEDFNLLFKNTMTGIRMT